MFGDTARGFTVEDMPAIQEIFTHITRTSVVKCKSDNLSPDPFHFISSLNLFCSDGYCHTVAAKFDLSFNDLTFYNIA